VASFTIGGTGAPAANGTLASGPTAWAVAIDPSGKFLYVGNLAGDSVSMYRIDGAGALSPIPGSPLAVGPGPLGIAISR
jgi:DNA-binding beta-propeller fold protein YncE